MSGTIAASRDGVGVTTPDANMHGVAFNADLYMGNTNKTDGVLYGILPPNATAAQRIDNAYLGNVYRAVNAAQTRDGKPIRIITSSWGSQPSAEDYTNMEPLPGEPATYGLGPSWRYMTTPEGMPDADGNTSHWLNHAIDVARTGTIIQLTAGNNGYRNPTTRGTAPHFLPDLEGKWYTTAGINATTGRTLNEDGSVKVPGTISTFNRCGLSKWWCVTAPGNSIQSTQVVRDATPGPHDRLQPVVRHIDVRPALGRRAPPDHAALPVHDQRAGAVHHVHDRPPERDDQRHVAAGAADRG